MAELTWHSYLSAAGRSFYVKNEGRDKRTKEQTNEQTNKRRKGRRNEQTNKRINEQTNKQMNEQTDKLTNEWASVCCPAGLQLPHPPPPVPLLPSPLPPIHPHTRPSRHRTPPLPPPGTPPALHHPSALHYPPPAGLNLHAKLVRLKIGFFTPRSWSNTKLIQIDIYKYIILYYIIEYYPIYLK